jgi:hypothetical protein
MSWSEVPRGTAELAILVVNLQPVPEAERSAIVVGLDGGAYRHA